jgi:general L-amino acid transport system permease protein
MSTTFVSIEPRPAPVKTEGLVPWMRRNLFGNLPSSVATIVMLGLAVLADPAVAELGHLQGRGGGQRRAVPGRARHRRLLGRDHREVPADHLRPLPVRAAMAALRWPRIALVALLVASCVRTFWKPWLLLLWVAVLALFFTLMKGGVLGLVPVETDRWGGLPLTIMLATLSMTVAFPLAMVWRWADAASMPAIRTCA